MQIQILYNPGNRTGNRTYKEVSLGLLIQDGSAIAKRLLSRRFCYSAKCKVDSSLPCLLLYPTLSYTVKFIRFSVMRP